MRLLRLTNSYDIDPAISAEGNKVSVCDRLLASATGEEVETTVRIIWPDPPLPGLIDRWLDRYEPDLVYLVVTSYWFTYRSPAVRLERVLGRTGKLLSRGGQRVAGQRWLAHNAVFRGLRRGVLAVIGGSTYFSPEQVNASMEECLRLILARENVAVAVRGPRVPFAPEGSARARRRAEERRLVVHRHVKELCARLHVPYLGWDAGVSPQDAPETFQGDFVHATEDHHAEVGELEAAVLLSAWRKLHPEVTVLP